jgi:hypothetical protein
MAAVVQAIEAAGLLAAAVIGALDTSSGQAASKSSGYALSGLGVITVVLLAAIAWGLFQSRPWTRTPAVMTQIIAGIVAILLIQGNRYDWGIPALLLAVAGLAGLLTPASLRALVRD